MRLRGHVGAESMVLWVGKLLDNVFSVTNLLIPKQKGIITSDGVCVVIEADELRRINRELYQNSLRLIAQIHSHPGRAYHSNTDDEFAIATTAGSLSLVVPNFAARPFSLHDYATYRLGVDGNWHELNRHEIDDLIVIEP